MDKNTKRLTDLLGALNVILNHKEEVLLIVNVHGKSFVTDPRTSDDYLIEPYAYSFDELEVKFIGAIMDERTRQLTELEEI